MTYKNNTFYDTTSIKDLDYFKKDVVKKSYNILLEQKYKHGVGYRVESELNLEETLNLITTNEDVTALHLRPNFDIKECFQIVFMNDWYFAWCNMDIDYKDYFIKKYKLKELDGLK